MRFKNRLSLAVLPLVLLPSLIAVTVIFIMTTQGIRELSFSALKLEMTAFVQQVSLEMDVLDRLGLSSSSFYTRSAQEKVAAYATSRSGPNGSFLILDGDSRVILSPVEEKGAISKAKIRALSVESGLVRFDPPGGGDWYIGIERQFPSWGWSSYLLIPESTPRRSAASVLMPGLFIFALGAAVASLVSRRLAVSVSRPIEKLAQITQRMGSGDLSSRAVVKGDEEVAALASSFNDMAGRLAEMTSNLEGQVASRTEELYAANVELSTALERLGEAQERLVRSEKLAALGQLSAGVAHELNTPLGAIASSGQTISDILDKHILAILRLTASLDPVLSERFFAILLSALEAAAGPLIVGDLALSRKAVRRLKADYEALGIEEAENLAVLVEESGLFEKAEAVAALIDAAGSARSLELLEAISELVSAKRMLQVISHASERAAHVVGALRGYLQNSDDEEANDIDVAVGIEAVLALLYHRTRRGVSINKRLEPGLFVKANANRLGQVWLNIINNALQAMEYKGDLSVEAMRQGNAIKVSISDSGPGIPEHIQPRIFEAFFTTKRQGAGIGLGLDICAKIVARYGGNVSFESEPGRTVFTVTLPAATVAQ